MQREFQLNNALPLVIADVSYMTIRIAGKVNNFEVLRQTQFQSWGANSEEQDHGR
jgi:hypothetical protein